MFSLNPANASTVRPAACDFELRTMRAHQSAGILPRCRHLRTASTLAPISTANAAGLSQRSIMLRTESTIPHLVGQSVLRRKVILSCDCDDLHSQIKYMTKSITDAEYRAQFLSRTKQAREEARFTQEEIAELLEIEQDQYKNYETRTMLPHRYISKFCIATKKSIGWLFDARAGNPTKRRNRARREKHDAIATPPVNAEFIRR